MSHASPAGTADVSFPRTSVAVTGASSGVGATVARRFSAQGWRPALDGRDAGRGLTRSALEGVVEAGLPGTSRLVRQVVPHLVEPGSGRVVPLGSVAGAVGVRGEAVYPAAEAAPGVFADAPRHEPRGSGVAARLVVPGVVDTPFSERPGVPRRRSWSGPVPPERVADAVWSAVSRGRDESRVPGRLRLPARVRGAPPGLYRRLAAVFG